LNHIAVNRHTSFIIVFALIVFTVCSLFWGVNGLTKNIKVVKVVMAINDCKAGLEPVQTEMLSTTDENEIKEILGTLQKPVFYRKLPDLGSVPANDSDFYELKIILQSDNNKSLEYFTDSHGRMKIEMLDGTFSSKNVNIFLSSNVRWFKQLRKLYIDKERNIKWVKTDVPKTTN
jgi:hypothetical protein